MSQGRYFHSATLLEDGNVLVVGGSDKDPPASAEVYDPSRNAWTESTSMSTPRRQHTATLLPDGRVLVVGGNITRGGGSMTASSEIYDPTARAWAPAADKQIRVANHTAVLLADGRVLVTGDFLRPPDATDTDGLPLHTIVPLAEVYDPATDSWSFTGQMTRRRGWPTATLLEDGTVLVVGGGSGSVQPPTAEIYYPATNTWSPTDRFSRDRFGHTETVLGDGTVLIVGGLSNDPQAPSRTSEAQIYDPSTRELSPVDGPAQARFDHGAILLFDGTVLIIGGLNLDGGLVAEAEIFDPLSQAWEFAGRMPRSAQPGLEPAVGWNGPGPRRFRW